MGRSCRSGNSGLPTDAGAALLDLAGRPSDTGEVGRSGGRWSVLEKGLYEKTVSLGLRRELAAAQDELAATIGQLDAAEASRVLSAYAAHAVRLALDSFEGKDALTQQVGFVNHLIEDMAASLEDDSELAGRLEDDRVDMSAKTPEQLLSLVPRKKQLDPGKPQALPRPETSVAETSLFTGAGHEPQLMGELRREIASADEILMLVSFVKWSGVRLLMGELRSFAERGGRLRVITTSYVGATDPKAVTELSRLPGASVKVSYDTGRTRLHAKAYVFRRRSGYTTAYVGSSNLSNPAMTSGLEWNVKVSRADQKDILDKICATFDTYWHDPEFEDYREQDEERLAEAIRHERGWDKEEGEGKVYSFDIRPYPYQQQILDALAAEREVGGHWRNLVVAATGTGKTVIAAFDYRSFCERQGRRARLLFVAHREEILRQSLACFRGVLKDQNFGSLMVGGERPETAPSHLFVSVQTLQSQKLWERFDPAYFEYIVVDEIHHAAASSYQEIFTCFQPKILLGLTATPERADGQSILPYFDGRIAAEIRLPEAIDRKLLCPFSYFGVTDEVSLQGLRWQRGGYAEADLENVYVLDERIARRRANLIIDATRRYVADIGHVRGLGFCVSKAHARFMAERFREAGIKAEAVCADTDEKARRQARDDLKDGRLQFIFAVDIYNEGVDIPEIDTVLFLRPTQSLTIFLQQLGRGLRLAPGKECLTVLDFIGQQDRRYDFTSKLEALLEPGREGLRSQIEEGFPSVPKGCSIQLEKVAQRYVLENISAAIGTKQSLVSAMAGFEQEAGRPLSLEVFLSFHHLDIRDIYRVASFSRLCVWAGVAPDFEEEDEEDLTKAFCRLCQIDSRRWIRFLLDALDHAEGLVWEELTCEQRRMLDMFQITLWPDSMRKRSGLKPKEGVPEFATSCDCLRRIAAEPHMAEEIRLILRHQLDHIALVDQQVDWGFPCPLDLSCVYTRDQIFIALGRFDTSNMRQGVAYLKDHRIDVLLNTLDKSEKAYSPSTMYEDYSIDALHFHWQSQNRTTPESPTGRRYQTQWDAGQGKPAKVALFVREAKSGRYGTEPYAFLGFCSCESAEGSRPMSIVWKLEHPIPARFLRLTARLAG